MWFNSIFCLTSVSPLQRFPLSSAVTFFCLSIFSKLFHAQTGNNQAFTGSSRVEWGAASSIHLSNVVLQCWGQKHTHTHSAQIHTHTHSRVESGQWQMVTDWSSESPVCVTWNHVWGGFSACVWAYCFLCCFSVMPTDESKGLQTKTDPIMKKTKKPKGVWDQKWNTQ